MQMCYQFNTYLIQREAVTVHHVLILTYQPAQHLILHFRMMATVVTLVPIHHKRNTIVINRDYDKIYRGLLSNVNPKSCDGSQFSQDATHRFSIAARNLCESQGTPVLHRQPTCLIRMRNRKKERKKKIGS